MSDAWFTYPGVGVYGEETPFDPFIGDPVQTKRTRAFCHVFVDGLDVTSRLEPHLVSLRVQDKPAGEIHLELDDRDASLPIPPPGANVTAYLGWAYEQAVKMASGYILRIEYAFGRKQGGRRMYIHATATNWLGQVKTPVQDHEGEGAPPGQQFGTPVPFSTLAQRAFSHAGETLLVHPDFSKANEWARDHWSQNNESALNLAMRHAEEMGAVFGMDRSNNYVFTKPGETVFGQREETSVVAEWGVNLIGLRVSPFEARSIWGSANQQFYDHQQGQWQNVLRQMGLPMPWNGGKATYALPAPAPNQQVATGHGEGIRNLQPYLVGDGRIVTNGEPNARWNTFVLLKGVRAGVDGYYRIKEAEHLYSRQGYVTWITTHPVGTRAPNSGDPNIGDGFPEGAP